MEVRCTAKLNSKLGSSVRSWCLSSFTRMTRRATTRARLANSLGLASVRRASGSRCRTFRTRPSGRRPSLL
eukprot:4891876-Lingulodinium_polyedra.AAC.1